MDKYQTMMRTQAVAMLDDFDRFDEVYKGPIQPIMIKRKCTFGEALDYYVRSGGNGKRKR